MVNKNLRFFFKLGVSCLFIAWVLFKVDIRAVLASFQGVTLPSYVVSTVVALITSVVVASKYHLLIRGTEISRSVPALMKINLISRFYALFLPPGIGPDAVRWYKVTRGREGRIFFAAATVFEKLTLIFMLAVFAGAPLFWYGEDPAIVKFRGMILPPLWVLLGAVCVSLLCFMFSGVRTRLFSAVRLILPSGWKGPDTEAVLKRLSVHEVGGSLWFQIFALAVLFQCLMITRVYLLYASTGAPLSLLDAAWMSSLVLLLQILPVFFAGIGIREGTYAYLFTLFGLAPEKGVLIGLLFFSQMVILAGLGGIFEMAEK